MRDYERKTGANVAFIASHCDVDASLAVKITLYRLLQESLGNGFRDAGGSDQCVDVASGDGFELQDTVKEGHLGRSGMRERVAILGGTFALVSKAGKGTIVRNWNDTLQLESCKKIHRTD